MRRALPVKPGFVEITLGSIVRGSYEVDKTGLFIYSRDVNDIVIAFSDKSFLFSVAANPLNLPPALFFAGPQKLLALV